MRVATPGRRRAMFPNGAMNRQGFLRSAALAGGAVWMVGCGGGSGSGGTSAGSTHPPIGKEPSELKVFEWPGYEAAGTKAQTYGLTAGSAYTKKFGAESLVYADFGNDDKALNQVRAGAKFDLVHPCIGSIEDWVEADLVQPWDPDLLPSMKQLYPKMLERGNIDGKQYLIPWDAGYGSVLYRTDKVDPADAAEGWKLFWNEKYAGKISMWDGGSTAIAVGGLVNGVEDPYTMTADQIDEAKNLMIEQKKVNKFYWSSEYGQMHPAFKSGDIWITYSWPNAWKLMRDAGIECEFMDTAPQGMLGWFCGFVLPKDTAGYHHAHAYVESFINKDACANLTNVFGYASANASVTVADVKDKALADKLNIGDPKAFDRPTCILEHQVSDLNAYQRAWEEVKAA
jgi:spermidine/putrescine transport system substrate-binding protein